MGICPSTAAGPTTSQSRGSDTSRNARAIAGSKCVPAQFATSRRAVLMLIARLYERTDVIVSKASVSRDDAPGESDVVARQTRGIAAAIEAFVMLTDRAAALSEPLGKRFREPDTLLWMATEDLQLVRIRSTGLVEDLGWYRELPDVVQRRGPPQSVLGVVVEIDLVRHELGQRANTLAVTPGASVIRVQCECKREDRVSVMLCRDRLGMLLCLEPRVKSCGGRSAQRHSKARRRLIGKDQRESCQHRQRHEPSRGTFDDDPGRQAGDPDDDRPYDPGRKVFRPAQQLADEEPDPDRGEHRYQHDHKPEREGRERVRSPL